MRKVSELDSVQRFLDPVEAAAAADAAAAERKLWLNPENVRVHERVEEHGVGFDNVDGTLYPYVF